MDRNVYIARHGHREDYLGEQWRRTARRPDDPGLSEIGFQQARDLGRHLRGAGIAHLFASPFLRAVQTASCVAEAIGGTVKVEEGICEWLNPAWFATPPQWLPLDELRRQYPRIDAGYRSRGKRQYPELDEHSVMWPAVARTLEAILAEYAGDILLVGHGASVGGMIHALGGAQPPVMASTCSLTHFAQRNGRWEMLLSACTDHLSTPEHQIRLA